MDRILCKTQNSFMRHKHHNQEITFLSGTQHIEHTCQRPIMYIIRGEGMVGTNSDMYIYGGTLYACITP